MNLGERHVDILADLLLDLLDKVLQKSKSTRTQIIVDIFAATIVLFAIGYAVWACAKGVNLRLL